jgi:hypothetical protein
MRRVFRYGMVAALLLVVAGAAPAMAVDRASVSIDANTIFATDPDPFTATGLPGCGSGTVVDGPVHFEFQRPINVFAGYKVFTCADAANGFVLRLNARFGDFGSVGTWSVVDAWGSLSGMAGAGDIVGDAVDGAILDHYRGTLTFP